MERNAITKTGPLKTMNMLPAIFATIVATKQIRIMLGREVRGGGGGNGEEQVIKSTNP